MTERQVCRKARTELAPPPPPPPPLLLLLVGKE
jgi:hypothetical protein